MPSPQSVPSAFPGAAPGASPGRIAVLADSDTRWKWGALTARRLAPEARMDGFLLRGRATPTPRQLAEVGVTVDSLREVTTAEFLHAATADRNPYDVVVLACVGGAVQALLHGLRAATSGARDGRRPVVVTGYVGVVYEKLTDGLLLRHGADVVLANSPYDAERFRSVYEGVGADSGGVTECALPFLGATPDGPDAGADRDAIAGAGAGAGVARASAAGAGAKAAAGAGAAGAAVGGGVVTGAAGVAGAVAGAVVGAAGSGGSGGSGGSEGVEDSEGSGGLGEPGRLGVPAGFGGGEGAVGEAGPFTVVFAVQPSVPASREDRAYLLRRAVAHARRHPERDVLIKLRSKPGEHTTHIEEEPYQKLVRGLPGGPRTGGGAADGRRGALPPNCRLVYGNMGEILDRARRTGGMLVTVSSTAALESLHRRVPTAVLTDLGVREALGNHYFTGSGCLASWDQLDDGLLPDADEKWMLRQGVRGSAGFTAARERVATLTERAARSGLPPLAPYYTARTSPGYQPALLRRYGLDPTGTPLDTGAGDGAGPGLVRRAVREAARGAYRHGVQRVAPLIRKAGEL